MEGISFVVPVYNVYEYLEECLNSILRQTDDRFEVVLVNDGSTDGSDILCSEWAKKYSKVKYYSKSNEGLGPTRIFGLKKATKEYVAFVDSDDKVRLDFVEKMLAHARCNPSDIIYCDWVYFGKGFKEEKRVFVRSSQQRAEADYFGRMTFGYPNIWGAMYKRRLWIENDIVMPGIIYEDTAIYGVLLQHARTVTTCCENLYYYRTGRPDGLFAMGQKDYRIMIKALEYMISYAKGRGEYRAEPFLTFSIAQLNGETRTKRYLLSSCEYQAMLEVIKSFFYSNFSGWELVFDANYITFGSYNLCKVYNYIKIIRQLNSDKYQHISIISLLSERLDCNCCRIKTEISDYRKGLLTRIINAEIKDIFLPRSILILDFLEEIYDIVRINNTYFLKDELLDDIEFEDTTECIQVDRKSQECKILWMQACDKMIDILREKEIKVFLIRNTPLRYSGLTEKESIINEGNHEMAELVDCYYDYFLTKCPEAIALDIPDEWKFSPVDDLYGNSVNYYNNYAHFIMYEEIIKHMFSYTRFLED